MAKFLVGESMDEYALRRRDELGLERRFERRQFGTRPRIVGSGGGSAPTPSFNLPLEDLGAGVVNIVADVGGVSPTFTRATPASTVLSNGLIGTVASGQPRSYYDPTTLTYLGYLAEGARTNLLLRSDDTTNAAWTKVDTTPTLSGVGPDGGANTANLLTEGAAGTARVTQSVTGTADANYSTSRFFKRGNTDWVVLNMGNGANEVTGWFNLATGAVGSITAGGTGVAGAITIQAFPNGWYRGTISGSVGSGATAIAVNTLSANANASTTRVANSTRLEWGAQFENNVSFASSYIATVGTTVTRNADVLTYPLTGWFNAAAGTLLVRGTNGIYSTGAFPIQASLHDGTVNEEINFFRLTNSTTARFAVNDGGAGQAAIALVTADSAAYAFSGAYAVNDFSAAYNGTLGTPDTSGTLPTVTTLGIACNANGNQPFGATRRFAYFPTRLANAQLQAISQ